MDSKYLNYLTKFGGNVKDVIDDEVWDEGVQSIRRLASEQQGALQNNKYLKWLMENTEGVIITDFLDRNMGTLDFSDMQLRELPNLSEFTELTRLSANNCGLTTLPSRNQLPDNIEVMSLVNNQLTEAPLDGWDTLTNLFVANLGKNPWTTINVDIFKKLFSEKLARLVLDVDLENLTPENRQQYESLLSQASQEGYMVQ